MKRLGDAVSTVDGLSLFDDRDLLGFVDGTEKPRGEEVVEAANIGEKDAAFGGGDAAHRLSRLNLWPRRCDIQQCRCRQL
jgi:deferrochelatase/peroxidase EfeB